MKIRFWKIENCESSMSQSRNKDARARPVFKGLCRYCKHSAECLFPRDPEVPVFHCEEFEDEDEIREPERDVNTKNTVDNKNCTAGPGSSSKFPGLCSNCAHRDTCVFPKPVSGVWHCDEYE